MNACKFSAFIVCLLFVLSACAPVTPPPAGEATPPTTAAATGQAEARLDSETVAKIEALVETTMAESQIPGFAIGIVKDGRIVYTKGFGVTTLDGGEPVTSRTLFQLAETSMMPTAIAILQLVDRGKLDLDAPVTDYLPYFGMKDERSKDITVGHLLSSRSGMRDLGDSYDSAMADWGTFVPQHDAGATERWVRSLSDERLLFAPGTSFGYSDQGYGLLGDVIAKASGQSYEDYVRENIFAPLGMEASTYLLEGVDRGMLASPHTSDAAGKVVASEKLPYHRPFAAANNLFSNVEEMARLVMASMNGGILEGTRILPEEAVKQMWTTHSATPFGEYAFGKVHPARLMQGWGYGWFIGDVQGQTAYTAFGNEYGYHNTISMVPDANVAVIAMGNGPRTSGLYATDIAADVTGMLLKASGNSK